MTTPPKRPAAAAPEPASSPEPTPTERLVACGQKLLIAVIDRAAGLAVDKVDDLSGTLEEIKASGGVGMSAALGGGLAKLAGKSPLIGAIKGAAAAMSTTTKVLIALALILTAVLAPVVLLVLALVLLVAAIVSAVRN